MFDDINYFDGAVYDFQYIADIHSYFIEKILYLV